MVTVQSNALQFQLIAAYGVEFSRIQFMVMESTKTIQMHRQYYTRYWFMFPHQMFGLYILQFILISMI